MYKFIKHLTLIDGEFCKKNKLAKTKNMSLVFQVKVIKTKIFSENLIQTEQRLEKVT